MLMDFFTKAFSDWGYGSARNSATEIAQAAPARELTTDQPLEIQFSNSATKFSIRQYY